MALPTLTEVIADLGGVAARRCACVSGLTYRCDACKAARALQEAEGVLRSTWCDVVGRGR